MVNLQGKNSFFSLTEQHSDAWAWQFALRVIATVGFTDS